VNEKPRDDLTVIKGIGPVWQKRLQESLGIYTFQDMAALSSDEIVSGLKPAPTKSDCEAWIRQAKELAATAESSEFENVESGNQTNPLAELSNWKPVASFVVEFLNRTMEIDTEQRQTKVQHIETDTNASWPGIENVALCRWMLEQMGETAFPGLDQQIEEIRAETQHELEQELELRRETAEQELRDTLEKERVRARQALQKELDEDRAQARQGLEQERTQAQQALQQELDDKRTQVQLELEQSLDEERVRAQQALQKELDQERAQARHKLEQERTQARQALQQELDDRRAQAQLELEQSLNEERTQARQALQKELGEERTQLRYELEQERTQAQQALQRELEEEQPTEPQVVLEHELVGIELQPKLEPESEAPLEVQPSVPEPISEQYDVLAITQLRAYQSGDVVEPVGTGIPGRPFSGFINGDQLLAFVVDFKLTEAATSEMTQQKMTYQAQFYLRDLLTGAKKHLGNTVANPLLEGRSSYIARLTDVTLDSGIYELTILVMVQNRRSKANYLMVPFFQVT
jgi:hypothetical protein